jgi:uncharacterized protein (DUF4415 family)
MSAQDTGKPSRGRARRRTPTGRPAKRKRVATAVSDPDTFIPDAAWWKGARVVLPPERDLVTMRLDADILAWFRRGGRGYQSRINAVLRAYMRARAGQG